MRASPRSPTARVPAPGHALLERVVAAGVEDDELQLAGRRHAGQHPVERHGLVLHVGGALQLGIDGNQVVAAVDLDAVAGVVDHGPVGAGGLVLERRQRLAHLRTPRS